MKKKEMALIKKYEEEIRKEMDLMSELPVGSEERERAAKTIKEYNTMIEDIKNRKHKSGYDWTSFAVGTALTSVATYVGYQFEKTGSLCSKTFSECRNDIHKFISGLRKK